MKVDSPSNTGQANPRLILRPGCFVFDTFERWWIADATRRGRAWVILLTFVGTMIWIGLGRLGYLPERMVLDKPLGYSIHMAFLLVLVSEIISLVLSLPRSVAESVGRQFEIFSLILLRQAFEEFSGQSEKAEWVFTLDSPVFHMIVDIGGAVVVFVLVTVYSRLQLHQRITSSEVEQTNFIGAKKLLATILLVVFGITAFMATRGYFGYGDPIPLFKTFYFTLIFTDVMIVLLAMRYSDDHAVVFRNAGFAACTLLIRIALSAPPIYNVMLGIISAGLLIALAASYRFSIQSHLQLKEASEHE